MVSKFGSELAIASTQKKDTLQTVIVVAMERVYDFTTGIMNLSFCLRRHGKTLSLSLELVKMMITTTTAIITISNGIAIAMARIAVRDNPSISSRLIMVIVLKR